MENPKTVIIVLGFVILITGLFWLGFSVQERYLTRRAAHEEAVVGREPTKEAPSSPPDATHRRIEFSPLIALGLGLTLVGYTWLVVVGFSEGAGWGVAVLVGNWLGAVAFLVVCPGRAWKPISVMSVGTVLVAWSVSGAYFP